MHADAIKGRSKGALDLLHQVVGIQNGILGSLRDALTAQGHNVGQSLHHNQEVAGKGAHLQTFRPRHQG